MCEEIMGNVLRTVRAMHMAKSLKEVREIHEMAEYALSEARQLKIISVEEWSFCDRLIFEVFHNWR